MSEGRVGQAGRGLLRSYLSAPLRIRAILPGAYADMLSEQLGELRWAIVSQAQGDVRHGRFGIEQEFASPTDLRLPLKLGETHTSDLPEPMSKI